MLATLTQVSPNCAKSPTCPTPLPAKSREVFSDRLGPDVCVRAEKPGALSRDAKMVIAYLSVRKSHWIPLKVGLEKVRGVKVVRSASPMVRDVWNWPFWADDTMTLLNQLW